MSILHFGQVAAHARIKLLAPRAAWLKLPAGDFAAAAKRRPNSGRACNIGGRNDDGNTSSFVWRDRHAFVAAIAQVVPETIR